MNINDVNQTINVAQTSQRQLATSNSKDGKELGKQDFLNLLMTQMSHQDPMDPMNTDSMMQQMASLGTVEQLQNLNAKTDSLLNYQEQLMRSGSAGFLGKDVEVQANEIQLMNGASAPISYELVGDADEVVLQIMNDVGDVVREREGTVRIIYRRRRQYNHVPEIPQHGIELCLGTQTHIPEGLCRRTVNLHEPPGMSTMDTNSRAGASPYSSKSASNAPVGTRRRIALLATG